MAVGSKLSGSAQRKKRAESLQLPIFRPWFRHLCLEADITAVQIHRAQLAKNHPRQTCWTLEQQTKLLIIRIKAHNEDQEERVGKLRASIDSTNIQIRELEDRAAAAIRRGSAPIPLHPDLDWENDLDESNWEDHNVTKNIGLALRNAGEKLRQLRRELAREVTMCYEMESCIEEFVAKGNIRSWQKKNWIQMTPTKRFLLDLYRRHESKGIKKVAEDLMQAEFNAELKARRQCDEEEKEIMLRFEERFCKFMQSFSSKYKHERILITELFREMVKKSEVMAA